MKKDSSLPLLILPSVFRFFSLPMMITTNLTTCFRGEATSFIEDNVIVLSLIALQVAQTLQKIN